MIFVYLLTFFVLAAISSLTFGLSTALFATAVYLLGVAIVFAFNVADKKSLKSVINVYQFVYIMGFVYIYACYWYMTSHDYDYLLAWDVHNYFMPTIESFLEQGSIGAAQAANWEKYNFFSRYQSGYFGYLIPFAYFSLYIGADLYISMQFSTLLVASLSGVVIFRLLLVNQIEPRKAHTYTLWICLFSVLFFYSTQLLRDTHVMFLYLLGIYLVVQKDFSIINLVKLLLVIVATCALRVESGLFLFTIVPIYLVTTMQRSRKRTLAIMMSVFIGIGGAAVSIVYFNQITSVLLKSSEAYLESDKGGGVIGSLQEIPVAGKVLSVIYNAAQPLPFWTKYEASVRDDRPEMYNIMTFPLSFASLFNWMVLVFIAAFLLNGKIRSRVSSLISQPLRYFLYLGCVYLYMLSAVIDQRRLMAFYVVFYILFFIIYTSLKNRDRNKLIFGGCASYVSLQVLAFLYTR